jgi:hypothetical protein
MSPEERRQITIESNQNRKFTRKARKALMERTKRNRRRVQCLDTGIIYQSILAACIAKKTYEQKLKYWIKTGKINMKILD